ncbi:hypothetical protein FIBSPDRAFT_488166 [Athelia psychrophila]|uniref:Uncharacterized protein n=1 Tax=Athelia psychrophila TaxID=1759441 RepID=A0A166KQV0_9AGAM|nr:hypothetical protein FIBSPDRAFT_488166 [Fibularhizoctonia sp. CBS 109695]
MGGYQIYDKDGPRYALDPETVIRFVRAGKITAPAAEEVADRSKGDVLSKGLAVIQTLWFVTQCIARRFEGLPLTNLEVITLAYTVITVAMYIAWWEKPLNVRCGIRVSMLSAQALYQEHILSPPPPLSPSSPPPLTFPSIGWWLSRVTHSAVTVEHSGREWMPPPPRPPPTPPPTFLTIFWKWLSRAIGSSMEHNGQLWSITMGWISAFIDGNQDSLVKLELLEGVPTFWTGVATKDIALLAHFVSIFVAISFAAVHYITWSNNFPSPLEQQLWQWSTAAITAVPVGLLAGLMLARMSPTGCADGARWSIGWWGGVCGKSVLAIGGPIYICARGTLFGLSFITLRSLPVAAYRIVEWSELIPHI